MIYYIHSLYWIYTIYCFGYKLRDIYKIFSVTYIYIKYFYTLINSTPNKTIKDDWVII